MALSYEHELCDRSFLMLIFEIVYENKQKYFITDKERKQDFSL